MHIIYDVRNCYYFLSHLMQQNNEVMGTASYIAILFRVATFLVITLLTNHKLH